MNWKCCFNHVIEGGAASEMVKWKTGLSSRTLTAVLDKQVNFGLAYISGLHLNLPRDNASLIRRFKENVGQL